VGLAQQIGKLFNLGVGGSGVRLNTYPATVAGTAFTATTIPVVAAKVVAFVAKATILVPFRIVGCAIDTQSAACLGFHVLGVGAAAAGAMTTVLWEYFQQYIAVAAGFPIAHWAPMAATVTPNGTTDAFLFALATAAGGETGNAHGVLATGMGN